MHPFPRCRSSSSGGVKRTEGPIERLATKAVVYAQQNNVPMCSIDHYGLVAAPALAQPVTLETPSTPIEVPHGYRRDDSGESRPYQRSGRGPGDHRASASARPGRAQERASPRKQARENHRDCGGGCASGNIDHRAAGQRKARRGRPCSRPARRHAQRRAAGGSLELATKVLEIKPGATVELKGKIDRKGSFDAPVTVKINGLPGRAEGRPGDRCRQGIELRRQSRRRTESRRRPPPTRASRWLSRSRRRIIRCRLLRWR